MHVIEFYIKVCTTETSSQAAELYIYFAPFRIFLFLCVVNTTKGKVQNLALASW